MKIHHLNCGSFSPRFPRLKGIVYCLLIESNDGLILVDTGFGAGDFKRPSPMMRFFTFLLKAPGREEETAANQIWELGFFPKDVKHIIFTHLHLDHSGGLPDFPQAQVHVNKREYEVAMRPRGVVERGYVRAHWAHKPKWVLYDKPDDEWFGFPCHRLLEGVEPAIYLIPLPGHTSGHCGVAIERENGWLFHCGDAASPFHSAVDPHGLPPAYQPLNFLPKSLVHQMIGRHVPRFRELLGKHGDSIELISSHDVYSFERLKTAATNPTADSR